MAVLRSQLVPKDNSLLALLNQPSTFENVVHAVNAGANALGSVVGVGTAIGDRIKQAQKEELDRYVQTQQRVLADATAGGDSLSTALATNEDARQAALNLAYAQRTGRVDRPLMAPIKADDPEAERKLAERQKFENTPTIFETLGHMVAGGNIADQRTGMKEQGYDKTDTVLEQLTPGWQNDPFLASQFGALKSQFGDVLDADEKSVLLATVRGLQDPTTWVQVAAKTGGAGYEDAVAQALNHVKQERPEWAAQFKREDGSYDDQAMLGELDKLSRQPQQPAAAAAPPTTPQPQPQPQASSGSPAEQAKALVTGALAGSSPETANFFAKQAHFGQVAPGYEKARQSPLWQNAVAQAYAAAPKQIADMLTTKDVSVEQKLEKAKLLGGVTLSLEQLAGASPALVAKDAALLRKAGFGGANVPAGPEADRALLNSYLATREGIAHSAAVKFVEGGGKDPKLLTTTLKASDAYFPSAGAGFAPPPTAAAPLVQGPPPSDAYKVFLNAYGKGKDATRLGFDPKDLDQALLKNTLALQAKTPEERAAYALTPQEQAALSGVTSLGKKIFTINRTAPVTLNGVKTTYGDALKGAQVSSETLNRTYDILTGTNVNVFELINDRRAMSIPAIKEMVGPALKAYLDKSQEGRLLVETALKAVKDREGIDIDKASLLERTQNNAKERALQAAALAARQDQTNKESYQGTAALINSYLSAWDKVRAATKDLSPGDQAKWLSGPGASLKATIDQLGTMVPEALRLSQGELTNKLSGQGLAGGTTAAAPVMAPTAPAQSPDLQAARDKQGVQNVLSRLK